jgi:dimethylamine/trimethylamine dehydrogenase
MGEEWRRDWHPERIPAGDPDTSVLVVGAGPAGLECARALGQRGFRVTIAEARDKLGGRVSIESKLPGLSTWARVRDYRTNLLQTMGNVDVYRGSALSADDVVEFGCDHAVIATGSTWTREVLDSNGNPAAEIESDSIFTPDDILAGAEPDGPIVIYDFDHYYMGSCLAELLRHKGHEVTVVTTANAVSAWTFMNNELGNIRARMIELGIDTIFENHLIEFSGGVAHLRSIYAGGGETAIDCGSLIVVGNRVGNDCLYQELQRDADRITNARMRSVRSIGDCRAPGAIVHAVYSGHECARTIDAHEPAELFKIERPLI